MKIVLILKYSKLYSVRFGHDNGTYFMILKRHMFIYYCKLNFGVVVVSKPVWFQNIPIGIG